MDDFAWSDVAHVFEIDGSLQDIYVFNVDLRAWDRVLCELRRASYELVYYRNHEVSELPGTVADAFPAEGESDRMLSVTFAGVQANCHFFATDQIEFDIDPREIQGQSQLNGVLAFMRFSSAATSKESVLTLENCPEYVVFRARPNCAAIDFSRFPFQQVPRRPWWRFW